MTLEEREKLFPDGSIWYHFTPVPCPGQPYLHMDIDRECVGVSSEWQATIRMRPSECKSLLRRLSYIVGSVEVDGAVSIKMEDA